MLFLLQVADAKISLFSLLGKGGWIMYPLYGLLVVAIFVFIERFLAIKKAGSIDPQFMLVIRDHIIGGNIAHASEKFFPTIIHQLSDYNPTIQLQKAILNEEAALLGALSHK